MLSCSEELTRNVVQPVGPILKFACDVLAAVGVAKTAPSSSWNSDCLDSATAGVTVAVLVSCRQLEEEMITRTDATYWSCRKMYIRTERKFAL